MRDSSATKLQCNIIYCFVVAKGGGEGGGGEGGTQHLERYRGGIHAQGLTTIGRAGSCDGRLYDW